MLDGTVDVPAVGRVKKRYVVIPAGLAAAYIAFRWWQAQQVDDEPAPGADGLYSSDDLSEYGLSTTGGSTTVTGNTGSTVTDATNPNVINDNAQWTERAVEKLTNQGFDGQAIYLALGEFLARRSLDKTEAAIARAALAAAGQPPVGGPYSVIEAATTAPAELKPPTGLKVTATTANSVTLAWDPVVGAGYYRVYRSGSSTNIGATDAGNKTIVISGLQPNTEYTFYVAADTTTGKPGPRSSGVKGRTKAVTLAKPSGLKASSVTKSSFRVTCSKVTGAQYYRWYLNGRPHGASDQPYRDFTSLKSNTTYSVTVAADTTNQNPGPQSSALRVKTKR
jgi:hypothetical protein